MKEQSWMDFSFSSDLSMLIHRLRSIVQRSRHFSSRSTEKPLRVVFFGSDRFSEHILEHLHHVWKTKHSSVIRDLEVMTTHSSSNIVQNRAEKLQLKTHLWPKFDPFLGQSFDMGILASFGQLLPKRLIEAFPLGIINVHPSLLPRWRGSSPLIYSIASGDEIGGVSIMDIRPKHFDIGPLLAQESFRLPTDLTMLQLLKLSAETGCRLLDQILDDPIAARNNAREQSSTNITYAHKLSKASFFIDWHRQTAEDIDRLHRALDGIANLRTMFRDKPVRLKSFRRIDDRTVIDELNRSAVEPGAAIFHKASNSICVRCKNGWVAFERLAYRKSMSARDFHNGYLSKIDRFQFQSVHNPLFDHVDQRRLPS